MERLTVPVAWFQEAGYRENTNPKSNDGVDAALLLTLGRNAASWLITEDRGVHAHARRLALQERVMTLADGLSTLKALRGQMPAHYGVDEVEPHTIDPAQPFFRSLEADYPDFRQWWEAKVVRQRRTCLLIGSGSSIHGLAVLDPQTAEVPALSAHTLKICTFKIDESQQGRKLGETLVDAVLAYARRNNYDGCFIETAEKQEGLLAMLREFGFFHAGDKPGSSDQILAKILNPKVDAGPPSDPLAYNRRYGPGRRLVERAFIVPIIPTYHGMLFPAAESQPSLFDSTYGNAVRKVYICHSPMKILQPGDTLFFLRTHDRQAVHAVGVVEEVIRTNELSELLRFAGARTVYTVEELEEMCAKGVLAIKFRLDQVLDQPVNRQELRMLQVFDDSPQSIAQIKTQDGMEWARSLQNA
ncbi:hypothetical protein StoSoilB3_43240 (plasmid) [Arthrobacter sp. StoSoilB3]|nr:hypothetical protein StoSoilB3_43240 [Arthrobacter sp. StoSoilB3]